MWEATYSCDDYTALLPFGIGWLIEKTEMGQRTLERHLPRLARIELLVAGDGGFRLPQFYMHHRQNGGSVRQNVRQNGGAYKEGNLGKDKMENLNLTSSLFQPSDDDAAAIREIQEQTGTAPEIAEGAFYLGIHRHYGSSNRSDPIRSVSFFVPIVKELERDANFLGAGPMYRQYLRHKAKQMMKAGVG